MSGKKAWELGTGCQHFVTAMFCQAHEELLKAHILCKLESAAREHRAQAHYRSLLPGIRAGAKAATLRTALAERAVTSPPWVTGARPLPAHSAV